MLRPRAHVVGTSMIMRARWPALFLPLIFVLHVAAAEPTKSHVGGRATASQRQPLELAHLRWRLAPTGAWTLGLSYCTTLARALRKDLAIKFPDVEVATVPGSTLTVSSECDATQGCTDAALREMISAAERVAETVGSFHWAERFGSLEVVTGVILPDQLLPADELNTFRLTLGYLPEVSTDPGMLNARLTIF